MSQSNSGHKAVGSDPQAVIPENYLSLAGFLEGSERIQRVHKKEPHSEAVRAAGALYEKREYVAAYQRFKPVYDKLVRDMQRILARNLEFEANRLAKEQQKPLAAAKRGIENMRAHAQQVMDQIERLWQDLEGKPLVRMHLKMRPTDSAAAMPVAAEATATPVDGGNETRLDANKLELTEVLVGEQRFMKAPYSPPERGTLYCVRDKSRGERIIRVIAKSPEGGQVQVEILEQGKPTKQPVQLAVDSLARQAARGWCAVLLPVEETEPASAEASQPAAASPIDNVTMRLDIQNFGRCCADILRANIKFDTQSIKDVGDGPFRAGHYEQAFLNFEQLAVGFTAAVANSRQSIAAGRRALIAEKGKLSGKEIEERKAAFTRSEQRIHTAEREFSTILEGLRVYLRTQQG